ncbi:MAG TPA: alpha-2-macroglobulin family protein, partial [Kofleriaceae bacterium]|nr:alpha-2-macroglobulin family protein [Kofleriaceae bacterium]
MKDRSTLARGIAALTLVPLVPLVPLALLSCGGNKPASGTKAGAGSASPLSDQVLVQTKDLPPGLDLRVSEGKAGPPAFDRAKLAPAKKLGDADAQALLSRARPLQRDPDDQQAFALRPGSQPAPRTGQTIKGAFPPPASSLLPPAAADAGKELRVVRWMPEGPVPLAPELSVTFSQPMIAVTSQTDAARVVPVKLTPQPPGSWRWIGTRTILFDPKVRFPQATTYQVEIPAGTKSFAGTALKAATAFSFETPPPRLVGSFPPSHAPQHVSVPMFALFDQRVDPAAVLAQVKITVDGKAHPARLLEAAELLQLAKSTRADEKQLAALIDAAKKNEQDGRWLAFRADQALPSDASVTVALGAGTPSAEGPNRTKDAQSFSFRTYPPLRIARAECGYRGDCPPGTPFTIEFNNPLDAERFDEQQLSVTPEIPGVKIVQTGDVISVMGLTKARTTYQVVVAGAVRDEFGQALGKDESRTFRVTDARPTFYGPSGMVVLDPAARRRTLDFFSTNYEQLKVRLYQVQPADYDAYGYYLRNQWNRDRPPPVPGKLVFDQLVKTPVGKNQLVETSIDLAPALSRSGLGHAIAIVEPHPWKERYEPPRMISWVQATNLAVDAHVDADSLVAYASDLATGKPAGGISLELRPFGIKGQTDDKGVGTLALAKGGTKGAHFLVARRGDDVAFVSDDGGYWNEYGSWARQERPSQLAWYVVDDRKLYKPGEEVTLKGWLRVLDPGKHGDLRGAAGVVSQLSYRVNDSRGNKIAQGSIAVSAAGGFDTRFTLPKTPNLGAAYVLLEAQGAMRGAHQHVFQIEEFRRPEFEVSAQASQGPFLVGGGGDVTVSAKYYSGGPLPGAPVAWTVTAGRTSYTPPNRDEYTFGEWIPWWTRPYGGGGGGGDDDFGGGDGDDEGGGGGRGPRSWSLAGTTDATGAHTMHLDFLSVKPSLPMSVTASASVVDVNRQAWSASSALIVHPSQLYVGLKAKKPFVEKGTPFELDVIGVDLDGKAAPGARIEVRAVRLDWEYKKGKYATVEVDPQACAVTAAAQPSACTFATKEGGSYQVTATIVDAKGRPNQTKLTFWVTGGAAPPAREVEQERVQIIPDKKEYRAGEHAELLLQAPFYPAEALVSWRRSGIVKIERMQLDGPTKVIAVPISDAMVPNLFVQVDLVGAAPRVDDKGVVDPKLPKRPAYAVGSIDLPVPPKQRTLAVAVEPSAPKVGPGESATLAVSVKDAAGRPVAGAEAAVIVVDEAILALTGYQFPSPIGVFYGHRWADTRDHYLRGQVKLARPDAGVLAQGSSAPGGGGVPPPPPPPPPAPMEPMAAATDDATRAPAKESSRARAKNKKGGKADEAERDSDKDSIADGEDADPNQAIAIRSNFNPLAAFAPAVVTDAAGRATVSVKVPDNLTRYRIVAIATAGEKQFGKGESALVARLPLMVRPSPPRFLNFGDTFQLPVVVQNQTDAPMTVKLATRTTNAALTDGAGREVLVPANDRVEVQFPAAAELAGTARFQIVGTAGKASDAAEVALPVWTPATTEAFA